MKKIFITLIISHMKKFLGFDFSNIKGDILSAAEAAIERLTQLITLN